MPTTIRVGRVGFSPPGIWELSYYPIPIGRGRLCPPHYYLPTRIWKPNSISDDRFKAFLILNSYILRISQLFNFTHRIGSISKARFKICIVHHLYLGKDLSYVKNLGDFFKILWPSQDIWTYKFKEFGLFLENIWMVH
jgi:hypothetical protein